MGPRAQRTADLYVQWAGAAAAAADDNAAAAAAADDDDNYVSYFQSQHKLIVV